MQEETLAKLRFALEAVRSDEAVFDPEVKLRCELEDVQKWLAARSAKEVRAERMRVIEKIERMATLLSERGDAHAWFEKADAELRGVAAGVNGPLLVALAELAGFCDVECIDLLRRGGPLVDKVKTSGQGVPKVKAPSQAMTVEEIVSNREQKNRALLESVREDKHAAKLTSLCRDDARMGRMRGPFEPHDPSAPKLDEVTITPRFCVEQGIKDDGSMKLRPIDDFSRSLCNHTVTTDEKLKYDGLDALVALLRQQHADFGVDLEMWKADIDSAYRRVPVAPSHRQFAWVAWREGGRTYLGQHLALPFGASASVYHWDRIGELIAAIARRLLKLPVLR